MSAESKPSPLDWARTYILGGGASAKDVDIASLRKTGVVLGINDAVLYAPCDALVCGDLGKARQLAAMGQWAEWGQRAHGLFPAGLEERQRLGPQATYWRRTVDGTPTMELGRVGLGVGHANTGAGAMNVSAQMGADEIVLVGFDYDEANEHWYPYEADKPETPWPPRLKLDTVIAGMEAIAPWYAERGIRVWNASKTSALKAYPWLDLEAS